MTTPFHDEPDSENLEEAEQLARAMLEADDAPDPYEEYWNHPDKYPSPPRLQFLGENNRWYYIQAVSGTIVQMTYDRNDALIANRTYYESLCKRFPGMIRIR